MWLWLTFKEPGIQASFFLLLSDNLLIFVIIIKLISTVCFTSSNLQIFCKLITLIWLWTFLLSTSGQLMSTNQMSLFPLAWLHPSLRLFSNQQVALQCLHLCFLGPIRSTETQKKPTRGHIRQPQPVTVDQTLIFEGVSLRNIIPWKQVNYQNTLYNHLYKKLTQHF